jgi:energy-coupling factor transporter ATP-binding protein EcfA2
MILSLCATYGVEMQGDALAEPIIRIENVSKSFGDLEVLKDLSFDVAPGEKLALIGPSGSGKTTILRILMTLETINGGMIHVDGDPLWHMPKNGPDPDPRGQQGRGRRAGARAAGHGRHGREGRSETGATLRRAKAEGGDCPRLGIATTDHAF